jgi:hypothetical protein
MWRYPARNENEEDRNMMSNIWIGIRHKASSRVALGAVSALLALSAGPSGTLGDPQDTCQPYSTRDSHVIDGQYANSNYCTSTTMGAGVYSGYTARAYVYFNVGPGGCAIPQDAAVTTAKLYLWDAVHVQSGTFCAYGVEADWGECGITWNNQPGYHASPSGCANLTGNMWGEFDILGIVSNWVSGAWNNDGLVVTSANGYCGFASREFSDPAYRPHLYIEYTIPPPPPPNDLCADAAPVSEGTFYADSRGADGDGGVSYPCGTSDDGHSVWWLYTPSWTGLATIDTCDSNFDTNLKLQSNSCTSGTQLACSDHSTHCSDSDRSWLQYTVTYGTSYLIRASSENGGPGGDVVLQISLPPLIGDLNCDGSVDFGDINPFVECLSSYTTWLGHHCNPLNADINGDGTYGQWSFGDINPFVALLTEQ